MEADITEHIDTHQMFIINCKAYPIELVQKEINCKPNFELVQNDKPDFRDSNLREYGWKIDHALTPQDKLILEGTPGYKDYKETILYKGQQGFAVLEANYKKDRHKLTVHLNHYEDVPNTMKIVKSIFERSWGLKLEPPKESDLIGKCKEQYVDISDLIEKLFGY